MISNFKYVVSVIAVVVLSGCATTKGLYDYKDYSETYYAMKKEPSNKSVAEWKTSMEEIVVTAREDSSRVPPGIYANLGYLHLKKNEPKQAISYFELEKKAYPESTVFMNNLIKKSKTGQGE